MELLGGKEEKGGEWGEKEAEEEGKGVGVGKKVRGGEERRGNEGGRFNLLFERGIRVFSSFFSHVTHD